MKLEPLSDDRCIVCGYPKSEEKCKTWILTDKKTGYTHSVIVYCGRDGVSVFEAMEG